MIPGGAGNFLAIPKNAKNPKAAWDYIATMQSPHGQLERFVELGRCLQCDSEPHTPPVRPCRRPRSPPS
jgi:spermidine/putrescine-binding protein